MNITTPPTLPTDLLTKLRQAKQIVVFTGAGVSAESDIPTFRDSLTGLWERFNAEDLATPAAFLKDRELVWGWYEWRRMRVLRAQPNPAHMAIAALAKLVAELTIITQNVDDLLERAGCTDVLHLHGSLHSPRCAICGQAHMFSPGIPDEPDGGRRLSPPVCQQCGGFVRPGVVWFGEELPVKVLHRAFSRSRTCDVLIVIGTSGLVQPAARIPAMAKQVGAYVIQINPTSSALDGDCSYSLIGTAGATLPRLLDCAFSKNDGLLSL